MNKKITDSPVTVVVSMWNSSSTIKKVLESIVIQRYPIKEVIVIDNHSSDNSAEIVNNFKKNNKNLKIQLIEREKTYGVSTSYNLGAKLSETDYFVTIHSDSSLPSKYELERLVKPLLKEKYGVASYPHVVHPRNIWLEYNFWQKCQFAHVFGTSRPSMNGKFDCYKKSIYQKIGGYDDKKFGADLGSEDADMHFRLEKFGKVIPTNAKVHHLHNLNKNFSFKNLMFSKKFLAVAYGAQIRFHWREMGLSVGYFLIKPLLVLSFLLGFINSMFFLPILLFPFVYFHRFFSDSAALKDLKILILPFIVYFFTFYETFWLFQSIFFRRK